MSDIKSALAKALNEWEPKPIGPIPMAPYKPIPTPTSEEAGGVAKGTFEFILNNPHLTKKTVMKSLALAGYKPASTSSLISAMVKQGMVQLSSNGLLLATVSEYTPVKGTYHKPTKKRAAPAKQGIAALEPQPEPSRYVLRKALDIDALIDTLTIREAITLHAKLSEALGK